MTHYEPAVVVFPEYTDERLRAGVTYGPPVADLLLTLPAEYRQPCEAEAYRRRNAGEGDLQQIRADVVAEILAQLAERRG